MVNFSRFHWLHPFLWSAAFAFVIRDIAARGRLANLAVVICIAQIFYVTDQSGVIRPYVKSSGTYADFYSAEIFDEISAHIGKPKEEYRVLSIGFHPAVALYNGFYALDGYVPNYPLQYKKLFYRLNRAEFSRNPLVKAYFDRWGSRVYAIPSELNYYMKPKRPNAIQRLRLDQKVFRQMGGRYVISSYEIARFDGFQFERTFEHPGSNKIWLYSAH